MSAEVSSAHVVLPEHIQKGIDAPPTYEDVMGGQAMTTVQKEDISLPPLSYIDIMPRCVKPGNMEGKLSPEFESFQAVIAAANDWLKANPNYCVWKCETFEKELRKDLTVDLMTMLEMESSQKWKVYITGIRLFLTTSGGNSKSPQQLGLLNVLPESEDIGAMKQRYRTKVPQIMAAGRNALNFPAGCMKTFVGMEENIKKLNAKLKSDPIKGSIINVETCVIKMAGSFEGATELDADKTSRHEGGNNFTRRYVHVLRVFYVLGSPAKEEVGSEVFVPDILALPEGAKKAKYEDFHGIHQKAGMWIKKQSDSVSVEAFAAVENGSKGRKTAMLPSSQGIRVVNILSGPVKAYEIIGLNESFCYIDADCTDDFDSNIERRMVQVIRVFYVKAPSMPSYGNANLSSRLFVPVRLGNKQFESMTQTMYRIEAWLRIARLQIFGVGTVRYKGDLAKKSLACGFDPDKTDVTLRVHETKAWITTIRLYFASSFQEPDVPLNSGPSNFDAPQGAPGGAEQNAAKGTDSKLAKNKSSSCFLI